MIDYSYLSSVKFVRRQNHRRLLSPGLSETGTVVSSVRQVTTGRGYLLSTNFLLELFRCLAQTLFDLFFCLIIQCKAMHGANNKNASIRRIVEKKDNVKFPTSVSFTLNILSVRDINPAFQNIIVAIK